MTDLAQLSRRLDAIAVAARRARNLTLAGNTRGQVHHGSDGTIIELRKSSSGPTILTAAVTIEIADTSGIPVFIPITSMHVYINRAFWRDIIDNDTGPFPFQFFANRRYRAGTVKIVTFNRQPPNARTFDLTVSNAQGVIASLINFNLDVPDGTEYDLDFSA
jgi:hypothetical protein